MLFKADSQIVAFDAKDPSEGPVLQPLSIEEESKVLLKIYVLGIIRNNIITNRFIKNTNFMCRL